MTNLARNSYSLFGVRLTVSGSARVLDTVHGRLRYFGAASEADTDLQFDFTTLASGERHQIAPPEGPRRAIGPPADAAFRLEYAPAADQVFASDEDRVLLLCDPATGRTTISIAHPEDDHLWIATHPMFVIALFEMLKRRGLFNLHAAGLSVDGSAVLLAGHSGSGKSTLAVALSRAGLELMSDDYVFLTQRPHGLRLLGFPEDIDLRDESTTMFPELAPVLQTPLREGWTKRQIKLDDYWPVRPAAEAAPSLLIFPQVGNTASSSITPINTGDAVSELVSNIQFTQPHLAQTHLDLIGGLVRASDCFRLTTGRDFDSLSSTIRKLAAAARDRHGAV